MEKHQSDITVNVTVDTSQIEIAQEKADKLLETLQKVHELIRQLNGNPNLLS